MIALALTDEELDTVCVCLEAVTKLDTLSSSDRVLQRIKAVQKRIVAAKQAQVEVAIWRTKQMGNTHVGFRNE